MHKQSRFVADIDRLASIAVSDATAQALLAKALYNGVVTFQTFKIAYDLFFEKAVRQPELYADSAPRTAWGLHNALTRALKESRPNVAFDTTLDLANVFGLGVDADASYALAA
jgi:hypothetical protein